MEVAFPEKEFKARLKRYRPDGKEGIDTVSTARKACTMSPATTPAGTKQERLLPGSMQWLQEGRSCEGEKPICSISRMKRMWHTTTLGTIIKIVNDILGAEMYDKTFEFEASEDKGFLELVADILESEGWTKGVMD